MALAGKDKDAIEAWVIINGADFEESWAAIKEVTGPEDLQLTIAAAGGSVSMQVGQVWTAMPKLYDSGALRHMTPLHNRFITYQEITLCPIMAADKRVFYMIGIGDVVIDVPNGKSSTQITFYMP